VGRRAHPGGRPHGDGRPDYTTINAFYRASAPRWRNAVRFEQQSITHHSQFTGVKYPYPHMTSMEGEDIIGGGMEYPMMTLIGAYTQAGDTALLQRGVARAGAHVVPHGDRRGRARYGWMDEGTTDFNENEARNDFYPGGPNPFLEEQRQYVGGVRATAWTCASCAGPTTSPRRRPAASRPTPSPPRCCWDAARADRRRAFLRGYRAYSQGWAYKHPKPWDFFNAFNTAAGRDLGWFWSTWYDNTWSLDQAVAERGRRDERDHDHGGGPRHRADARAAGHHAPGRPDGAPRGAGGDLAHRRALGHRHLPAGSSPW
jgi:hypothetical protein